MKTLLQAIGEIIRPDLRRDGVIRLVEDDPGSTCRPVTLHRRGQALVLKLDSLPPPLCRNPGCQIRYTVNDRMFPLFRIDVEGVAALSDYIVFYQERDADEATLFVFLCELKSGEPRGAKKQAENGRLMADYVINMALHHLRPQPVKIERRGLIFSPRLELPKIGNPTRDRYPYAPSRQGTADMKVAYCRDGAEYPLSYFCA